MTALPYTLIEDVPAQLGLVVLQSDETIEADMRRLLPDEAELLVTRIPSAEVVSQATLAAMEDDLVGAVALFPRAARFAVVGYGCTSGTAQIGAERIAGLVRAGCDARAVTQPMSALVAACRHLGVRRLGLVTPYVAAVSERLIEGLAVEGLEVVAFGSFDEEQEARVVRIAPDAVRAAAVSVAAEADCDALFLSCTNLRTLDVITSIEVATGLPVLSSNLVLAWDMVRQAGLTGAEDAPGRLWHGEKTTGG